MIAAIIAAIITVVSMLFHMYWLSAVGLGMATYYLVRFLSEVGRDIPIESFILVIVATQWIVGPIMTYSGFSEHYKYYMYVTEEEYMWLVIPSVLFLSIGLYAFHAKKRLRFIKKISSTTWGLVSRTKNLPYYLIGIGFIFSLVGSYLPSSLVFPVYILSNIKYIGLIYLLFSRQIKAKKTILTLAFIATFLSSLQDAMFHDFLIWMSFIGMYAAFVFQPSTRQKILATIVGVLLIFVLQATKDQYRLMLMESGRSGYLDKFVTSIDERLTANNESQRDNIERLVNRINQGWIISRIMYIVPNTVPHANGETVLTAIKASILPRILYPDKPKAGGRANYEKYTGFKLTSGTSMGVSLMGEAYINFGVKGAWGFMLLFGLITSFVIRQIFLLAFKYPTIWLWFPLIFLHFIKAETELLVQLNHLTKTFIIVLVFIYLNKKFLKTRL